MKKIIENFLYSIAIFGLLIDGSPAGYRMVKELEQKKQRSKICEVDPKGASSDKDRSKIILNLLA
jgi:hypothetical protein